MVSAEDTDISLHIRPGPISNLADFFGGGEINLNGGGYSGEVKT